ncbi:MAG: CBS domain-containing protein [Chloroflexota bacterium]
MTTVSKILAAKGGQIWSVTPSTRLYEALKLMADKDIGALLVFDDDDDTKIAGIISERDYARKVILEGKNSMIVPISEIMTERVLCISPGTTLEECMALMTDKHIRHLPVMEEEDLVGIISIGDVVKELISEQKFVIDQLENYIRGF